MKTDPYERLTLVCNDVLERLVNARELADCLAPCPKQTRIRDALEAMGVEREYTGGAIPIDQPTEPTEPEAPEPEAPEPVRSYPYHVEVMVKAKELDLHPTDPEFVANMMVDFGSERDHYRARTREAEREVGYLLDVIAREKGIHVICRQRDCDCVDFSQKRRFANPDEFEEWREKTYDNAEGPCNVLIVTKEEYDGYECDTVDHIMRAFEDGHGGRVIIE